MRIDPRRLLRSLAFSFLIIALFLAWEAYGAITGKRGAVSEWRITVYVIGAVMALLLGVQGLRERHRSE